MSGTKALLLRRQERQARSVSPLLKKYKFYAPHDNARLKQVVGDSYYYAMTSARRSYPKAKMSGSDTVRRA